MSIITPNLGLRVWNLTTDPYDHAQLADNWAKVDEHNHAAGRGLQIPTGGIQDGAVTAAKVAAGVIPSSLTLDDGSVTTAKLAANAVTAAKLATNSVDSSNIVNLSIATGDIADSAITTAKLTTSSVTSSIIASGAVDTSEINDGAVTINKLDDGLADEVSVNSGGIFRRGFTSTSASESWAGTPGTYSNLPTPDSVATISMPADGLLFIAYRALFKVAGASNDGSATIFVGSTQLKSVADDQATPVTVDENLNHLATKWSPITTTISGLGSGHNGILGSRASTTTDSGYDNTQPIAWNADDSIRWSPVVIEAPAGTYNVSVRYKTAGTSGGTLSVKNRKLWVWTVGF